MKLKYFAFSNIIIFNIFAATIAAADEIDKNEFCAATKREDEQCGTYAYKVLKPLLNYFHKHQSKIENNEHFIEAKDREISELQVKLSELQQKVTEKDNVIEVYKKLEDSNALRIQDLRNEVVTFTSCCMSAKEISAQLAVLAKTLNEQESEIKKLKAQIASDDADIQKCANQTGNQRNLISEKHELINKLEAQVHNLAKELNETQVIMRECKDSIFAENCMPFANSTGIHKIKVPGLDPFDVLCGSARTESGWIVMQQRINGKENFYRDWATYQAGFGSFDGDFFLGLERIHRLIANQRHELYIHLERFDGRITYASYDNFAISGESDQYRLISVDGFAGNETKDSMAYHKGNKFYTFDRDNGCAIDLHAGWWYDYCAMCNLNGQYFDRETVHPTSNYWYGSYSLKKVQMLIRPKQVSKTV